MAKEEDCHGGTGLAYAMYAQVACLHQQTEFNSQLSKDMVGFRLPHLV
jgi:hypothetical protein